MIHPIFHKNNDLINMLPTFLNHKILSPKFSIAILTLAVCMPATLSPAWAQNPAAAATPAATAPAWQIIADKSRLGFKAKYSNIEFDGRFNTFTAKILFDPKHPEAGLFDVNIDTTSITTFNAERDSVIGDQDWFYFSKYPTSTYVTKSIKATGNGQYVAVGTLDLKGHKKDVELRYTWNEFPNGDVEVQGQARMQAEANLNRVDFAIGSGSWEKDDTVGFEVLVKINLLLTPGK